MSKSAVALRHLAFEDLGSLAPVLSALGYEVTTLDAGCDDISGPMVREADLLIVLGGPIGVYEAETYPFLDDEKASIRARVGVNAPTLGICLGAQLIASALGADVTLGTAKEIGFAPLDLTSAGAAGPLRHLAGVPVLHWHGDVSSLPADAACLASTALCHNQAFSIGSNILGLQFHAEVDLTVGFERWLVGHTCELAVARIDPRDLRAEAAHHAAALHNAGRALFVEWCEGYRHALTRAPLRGNGPAKTTTVFRRRGVPNTRRRPRPRHGTETAPRRPATYAARIRA